MVRRNQAGHEEHVWPKWVSRVLKSPGYNVDHFRHLQSEGDNTTKNWTANNYIGVTTKTVCDKCNNEWLSIFEDTIVRPVLEPLLLDPPQTVLSAEHQQLLAAWAYKMALLLDFAMPDSTQTQFFTQAEREDFRRSKAVHPFLRVLAASYKSGWHPSHAQTPRIGFTPRGWEGDPRHVKVTTVSAGYFVMQVIAVRSDITSELMHFKEMDFVMSAKAEASLLHFQPPTLPSIAWPPPLTLTPETLEAVTAMWNASTE